MAKNILPPAEELRNILDYDPETGIFLWKVSRQGTSGIGSVAGRNLNGYRHIKISGIRYSAHRLAWKMTTGFDPVNEIDHINGERSDNRIANLREATRSENVRNQGKRTTNTSGHKGVSFNKPTGKWVTKIVIAGKKKHIGYFTDIHEAAASYAAAATASHGEFLNLGTKGNNNV